MIYIIIDAPQRTEQHEHSKNPNAKEKVGPTNFTASKNIHQARAQEMTQLLQRKKDHSLMWPRPSGTDSNELCPAWITQAPTGTAAQAKGCCHRACHGSERSLWKLGISLVSDLARGTSHHERLMGQTLDELPLTLASPLKYTDCGVCLNFWEKNSVFA
jgi:hypothetical protein